MANRGYPDDDDSRTASGDHDLGRQRNNCYDAGAMMRPATVADYLRNEDPITNMSTSAGDGKMCPSNIPIDGNSNSDGHDYNPAAYPAYTSMA